MLIMSCICIFDNFQKVLLLKTIRRSHFSHKCSLAALFSGSELVGNMASETTFDHWKVVFFMPIKRKSSNFKWLEAALNLVKIKNPFGSVQTNPQADAWWVPLFIFLKVFFWDTLIFIQTKYSFF